MNDPLVSVSCTTYNHAPYIRECLDGFLMQKCNFSFEILIHDDASTDTTSNIIREYHNKHPNIIKPIIQTENQWSKGIKPTWKYNIPRAKGKYIALCEGDDYWIDPLKLQKQVDFLEKDENYSLIGSNAHEQIKQNLIPCTDTSPKEITTEDIVQFGPLLHTCTIMFRNKPNWFDSPLLTRSGLRDWSLVFLYSLKGKVKRLEDTTGVYRRHDGGIYSALDIREKYKENIVFQRLLMREYPQYKKIIDKHIKQKIKQYALYDYSVKAVVLGQTPVAAFLYELRVKLNLRRRICRLLKK